MGLLDRAEPSGQFDDLVDAFIRRLDRLDQGQLLALRAAWRAIPRETHEEQWALVRGIAKSHRIEADVDGVRERAMHWAMRGDNRPPLYHIAMDDEMAGQIRATAAAAIVDAALALTLREWLPRGAYAVLAGPWESVVGPLAAVAPSSRSRRSSS